jgi:uncharacterized protein YecT (DUF1311 family)
MRRSITIDGGLHVYFHPPHAIQACYGGIVLPYTALDKYLNRSEAARIGWSISSSKPASQMTETGNSSNTRGGSSSNQAALGSLIKAKDAFLEARAGAEVASNAAFQRKVDEDNFLEILSQLKSGKLPSHTSAETSQEDNKLNSVYRLVQTGLGRDETKLQVRTIERQWIAYRDAWLRFAAVQYPNTDPNSLVYALTQRRVDQLSEFAALSQSAGK